MNTMHLIGRVMNVLIIGMLLSFCAFSSHRGGAEDREKQIRDLAKTIKERQSTERLIEIGGEVAPYLTPLLKTANAEEGFWISYTLLMVGNNEGVKIVKESVKSDDRTVRIHAAGALYFKDLASQEEIDVLIT